MAPRRCRSSWLASRWATTLVRTLPLPERDVWHAQAFGKRAGGADPSRLATIGPGRRRRQDAWRRPCPRTTRSHGFYSSGRSLPVARCWATARRALHDALAKLFALAFAILLLLDRIRQDRAWATRRRSHLPRLERSGGRRGHFALLIARRREETDLRLVAGFARPTDVDFFICARTRPALWEARNGLGFIETPLSFLWFARAI